MRYAPRLLRQLTLLISCALMFAFVIVLPMAAACGGSLGGKKVDWPSYVACAPGVSDVVATVSTILLGDGTDTTIGERGKRELNDLALKHGADTVACLVQKVVSDWTQPGLTQDPAVTAGAARGRAFLKEVGTVAHVEDDGPHSLLRLQVLPLSEVHDIPHGGVVDVELIREVDEGWRASTSAGRPQSTDLAHLVVAELHHPVLFALGHHVFAVRHKAVLHVLGERASPQMLISYARGVVAELRFMQDEEAIGNGAVLHLERVDVRTHDPLSSQPEQAVARGVLRS